MSSTISPVLVRRWRVGVFWGSVIALVALGCSTKSSGTMAGAAGNNGRAGTAGGAGGATSAGGAAGTVDAAAGGAAGAADAAADTAGRAGAGAAGVGGAGAGGRGAGVAGAGGAAGSLADVGLGFQDTTASVLTRNKHETRDGFFIQPTLTMAKAARMLVDAGFVAKFDGGMRGSPLYLENGPGGNGAFFVGTTTNDVYALDETTGATVWKHSIGMAPAKPGVMCGNVFPVGILSTPVIDATSRTIFVAGAVGDATTIMRHEVHALSVDTGLERPGWPVNVSALTAPGGVVFNSPAQNQRGALSLVGGILYVPYGGHGGDCGQYRGWVVAIDTAKPSEAAAWATGGIGEGIWASGGMASAGDGVFATTGNNTAGAVTHADSEEVVHVTGLAKVDRSTGIFVPGTWREMDARDADFGSSNAVAFRVPSSTPSTVVAAVTKNGQFFLLNPANLGGMDGHLARLNVTPETSNAIHDAPAAYVSTSGVHVVFSAMNTGAVCPAGTVVYGPFATVSILISPGSPPTPKVAWCGPGTVQSPIVTTTDGTHEAIVWMYGGALYGVDAETGRIVFSGGGTDLCAGVRQMTSPIAVKGRIILGADGRLCSYSPH